MNSQGGPDELYDFAEAASDNPTFYADLTNPQSLNNISIVITTPYVTSIQTDTKRMKANNNSKVRRQFDNGELIFYKGNDGKWHPSPATYDIGDEVKAWAAQLNTSTSTDFWKTEGSERKPSLLREFANAKTDDERAGVLARTSGYRNRNPRQNSDYVYAGKENYKPGQLVRTSDTFGRVNRVAPPRPN